jgi:WhiB family transcriptional regulator, redox-sensing transcriptional regulator
VWEKGACHDVSTEVFYPDRDARTYQGTASIAKTYCHGHGHQPVCPVVLECLFYGLITNDNFGIWGGRSPRERNALRRSKSLAKYQEVQHLRGSPYYVLIEDYLEQHAKDADDEGR